MILEVQSALVWAGTISSIHRHILHSWNTNETWRVFPMEYMHRIYGAGSIYTWVAQFYIKMRALSMLFFKILFYIFFLCSTMILACLENCTFPPGNQMENMNVQVYNSQCGILIRFPCWFFLVHVLSFLSVSPEVLICIWFLKAKREWAKLFEMTMTYFCLLGL